jgi:exosortase E/protease (VPEID-CTERM system)
MAIDHSHHAERRTIDPSRGAELAPLLRPGVRAALFLGLLILEVPATSLLFELKAEWRLPVIVLRVLAMSSIVAAIAFVVLVWPARHELRARWTTSIGEVGVHRSLAFNLALLGPLLAATVAFTRYADGVAHVPWGLFSLYAVLLGAVGTSLVALAAPFRFWLTLPRRWPIETALAVICALAVLVFSELAALGWEPLAQATLEVTGWMLRLYETGVEIDAAQRIIAIGDFAVHVDRACSGYEGIGLVVSFVSIYLWAFRATLRFPHALVLLPVGALLIWLLNSARIAALASLGAHVSADLAALGFHSQAGWITFLLVTVGLMASPRAIVCLRRGQTPTAAVNLPADHGDRLLVGSLAPFIVLMLATIVMQASAPYDHWLYVLKVAGVAVAVWAYRDVLRPLVAVRIAPTSVLAGLVVGVLWVATQQAPGDGGKVAAWLAEQPWSLAALWLGLRALGAVVMVPLAEELAFRSVLYRWIVARGFERVPLTHFSWLALVLSSAAFGVLHERWLAGALAGAAFALVMIRSGRLSDAVAAHRAANAAIVSWALLARQWSLL